MRIFFDTSAFVKRYVSEAGTDARQHEAAARAGLRVATV